MIRFATEADVDVIGELIRGLAEYERLAHEVTWTRDELRRNLFGPRRYAEVLLAEDDATRRVVGFALFFHNFSTFLGKPGIYLEDLFVRTAHRGKGHGKRLLRELARLALERGCGRLEWWVLDWNTPAIEFYKSIGAVPMDEWTVFRVTGEKLRQLAATDETARPVEPPTGEAPVPTRDATISLHEVTKENLVPVLRLKVAPEQERFVATNAVSIAQAHFHAEVAWFRAVYADKTPVGFLMLEDKPQAPSYVLWRFMIDRRFQRLGFGARAIRLLVEHVRTRPGARELLTSCVPGDGSPRAFYEKLGFVHTGEVDPDGELVMRLQL